MWSICHICFRHQVYHNSIGVLEDGQYCYVGPNRVFRTISELVAFYTAITNAPHLKLTKAAPVTQHP
ncbi:hypothetical protein PTSG_11658 [Salpingoeca rosetta]|uniref:SH2 domain-containing protein n=1 Tax=Salpingoeca rosetta (strain ATCC 50818 / BSB-021) TaxID=946362 RepID=F2TXW8_SALR5|nr:uncharacterized protein PTSG_11658 [Salpingoeca rosetta]EGD76227.1 hypothetical protein PTSG_11658 [Salpingoeca rosetta]|eukprot:XP_004998402.1 hypothetical protein PTSG_11658 [Salpingoeca rosetta]